jgi:hypothetical protein
MKPAELHVWRQSFQAPDEMEVTACTPGPPPPATGPGSNGRLSVGLRRGHGPRDDALPLWLPGLPLPQRTSSCLAGIAAGTTALIGSRTTAAAI